MTILRDDEERLWVENEPTIDQEVKVEVNDQAPIIGQERNETTEIIGRCGKFSTGLTLAFISGIIFSANSYLIQVFELDYAETMLIRSLIQVVLIGGIVWVQSLPLWPIVEENPIRTKILMVGQGVLGSVMVMCSFSCVLFLPLGDALTLIFSAPLSTMVMTAIFLGHKLRLYKVTFALILLTGTVLVVRPPFLFPSSKGTTVQHNNFSFFTDFYFVRSQDEVMTTENHRGVFINHVDYIESKDHLYYIGVAIALSSALADGFLNVAINLCHRVPSLVLLWWTGIGGLLVSLIAFTFDDKARMLTSQFGDISSTDWMAFVFMALAGIVAYFCMTKSLQMIDPTIVAFVRALEIVFAYVIQVAIIREIPPILSIVGASLVLISVFAMALREKIVALLPTKIRFIF